MTMTGKDPQSKKAKLKNLTPEQIEKLLQKKRQKQKAAARAEDQPIPRAESENGLYPLSFSQQRLWFLDRMEGSSAAYNIPVGIWFHGEVNIDAIIASLNAVIERHESLRTVFVEIEGQPFQRVLERWEPLIRVIELSELIDLDRLLTEDLDKAAQKAVSDYLNADAARPFNLERDLMIRATVIQVSEKLTALIVNMHHIASDGWSMGVLVAEFGEYYRNFSQGTQPQLQPMPIQYKDYSVWQRSRLDGEGAQKQIEYWRQQLDGLPPLLELPTDRPRPPIKSYRGAEYHFTLPGELLTEMKSFANREGITLFMVLLAAYEILLFKYSHQTDFAVGSPVANRKRPELEGLIGFFVNSITLRASIDDSITVQDLLKKVKNTTLEAYAHQDVPFERVVDVLNPERSLSYSPLYQVALTLQNTPQSRLEVGRTTMSMIPKVSGTAQFDLALGIVESGRDACAVLEYCIDLFDLDTIDRIARHFLRILEQIICSRTAEKTMSTQTTIASIDILSEAERTELLQDWNSHRIEWPEVPSVQSLIEAQVLKTPEAVAVICGKRELTYSELSLRSNQLAQFLIAQKIEPDSRVGICLNAGVDLLIAILGTLKAGCAYVPMDTNYPRERLGYMLSDSQAPFVITQASMLEKLPAHHSKIVCVDRDGDEIAGHSTDAPFCQRLFDRLLYVIYTSGSTGQPKGAGVYHRNELNLLHWYVTNYAMTDQDRKMVISSIGFDLTQKNLFALLTCGGTVVFPEMEHYDPMIIAQAIDRHGITLLNCAPSAFYSLTQSSREYCHLGSLRLVLFGGEPIKLNRMADWITSRYFHAEIVNMYGPTECTDIASTYRITAPIEMLAQKSAPVVPIGRPCANIQLYVLSQNQHLLPKGATGELYIGGAGVGAGYLNSPELTAQKFIDNPFGEGRLYQTGDLVHYQPDGNLVFVNRIDFQVKLRGLRVELGEIEHAMKQLPGVADSLAIVDDEKLYGFVLTRDKIDENWRSRLGDYLPDYMVPGVLVTVTEWPLTPNGKIDRKALLAQTADVTSSVEYVAPGKESELRLAAIWQELIGREKIGIHDNFFDLGGHSLLVVQVVSRIRQSMSLEIPVKTLFENPTIATLADAIEKCDQSTQEILPPIVPVSRDREIPLSFGQQRLWLIQTIDPDDFSYNMPIALRIEGELDVDSFRQAIQQMVDRHEVLRTVITPVDNGAVQTIHPVVHVEVPLFDFSGQSDTEERTSELVREYASHRFDLSQGPLIISALIRLGNADHVMMITMHHIVSDGWSMGLFVNEFIEIYLAIREGREPKLAQLPIQYADYAVWQSQNRDYFEQQMAYWLDKFSSEPEVLDLPRDYPRPAVRSGRGAVYGFHFNRELTDALDSLCRRCHCTRFMALLAMVNVLLYRYTRQTDICIGTPIANRDRLELEPLIGFLVNTLVIRTELDGEQTFDQLLQQVRQTVLEDFAHQDAQFEQLVSKLNLTRSLNHTPLFQVMYSHQPQASAEGAKLQGLHFKPFGESTVSSKFDMTISSRDFSEGIFFSVTFSAEIFELSSIERMFRHLQQLALTLTGNSDQKVGTCHILDKVEMERVVTEWNQTEVSRPEICVHRQFEEWARKTPDSLAVRCGSEYLDYFALNQRANQLASRLIDSGLSRSQFVGLYVERSVEMIVGLLAILKAGGSYLPIDPVYPQERVEYMLQDSNAQIVITTKQLGETLSEYPGKVIEVDSMMKLPLGERLADPDTPVCGNDRVYTIYTSGSTGKPKGTSLYHKGLSNLISFYQGHVGFTPDDRVLIFSSISFDLTQRNIFGALCSGSELHLYESQYYDPELILETISDQGITFVCCAPSAFYPLLDREDSKEKIKSLRHIVLGGEAMDARRLDTPAVIQNEFVISNLYGPTETTATCSSYRVDPEEIKRHCDIPIGKPINNVRIYLLDTGLNPVPVGVVGEIYAAGIGVGEGYMNRPDLTAEVFIPDPYAKEPGSRMYCTGDLGRYLDDGNIMFIGRRDFQVKIRGQRIEPGEVESRLLDIEKIAAATVIAFSSNQGETQLAAYLVAAGDQPSLQEIRDSLGSELPAYMMPSSIMFIDEIPLTVNGKVDRRALPEPEIIRAGLEQDYIAPRNETEQLLADIWCEVLEIDTVGIRNDFFEVGGHSLLAVTLIERMRKAGFSFDVKTLFLNPTIERLVACQSDDTVKEFKIPPNLIPADCHAITPEMLPLVELSQDEINQIVAATPGGVGNIQDIYPLAPLQEGILFHHMLQLGSDPYLLCNTLSFSSEESLKRFLDAVRVVIKRHDILRTAFCWKNMKHPLQVVWRNVELRAEEVRFEGDINCREALESKYNSVNYQVDISTAPVIRCFYVRDAANDRWLMRLLMHHLLSDHISQDIILDEIMSCMQNGADRLPAAVPYRNYIAAACLGVTREAHAAFFKKMLSDIEEPTAPFGLADVHGDGQGLQEEFIWLDDEFSMRLRQLSRDAGVSLASLCHLAWGVVLARTTGKQNVVFGTLLFGRMQGGEEAARAIGVYINTLPIRIDCHSKPVGEVLRETHNLLAELILHEHAPLAIAQHCSSVPSQLPLFSTLLNYRHTRLTVPTSAQEQPDRQIEVNHIGIEERTNYPVTMSVDDFGERMSLKIQAVESIDIMQLGDYMQNALTGLADALENDPTAVMTSIDILSEAERFQLLEEWNGRHIEWPPATTLDLLVAVQAEERPDDIAVSDGGSELSYTGLNSRANRLANWLLSQGVNKGDLVGLCMERSTDMVVAMLAIMRAGAAYVPIDPDYPLDRIEYIARDASLTVFLVQDRIKLPDFAGLIRVASLDQLKLDDIDDCPPAIEMTSSDLVYVIYTSGSTGLPKGVEVNHAGVINLCRWHQRVFEVDDSCRATQMAGMGFDATGWEIWPYLTAGASVTIVPRATTLEPAKLIAFYQAHAITHSFVPTPVTERLLDTDWPAQIALKYILTGGDRLSRHPRPGLPFKLVNNYGPTEASVVTTSCIVEPGLEGAPPIGYPVDNLQVYVLDEALRPVPVGVTGELCVGGIGLARGYRNLPEQTKAAFVSNPFSSDESAKLYRTGDLVRHRPDGMIEFIGRKDFQVKIRGFRIELGEIEAVLNRIEGVRDSVVLARSDISPTRQLVAYLEVNADLEKETVRQHLQASLPEYMVPAFYVTLSEFPMTANGKVDRDALPLPDMSAAAERFVAPSSDREKQLAGIWQEVLGTGQSIGIHDNFFDLGGNSLVATQLMGRIREALQVELPLKLLFDSPTIAGLLDSVGDQLASESGDQTELLTPDKCIVDRTRPLPLSSAQVRLWFLARLDPHSSAYNMDSSVRIRSQVDSDLLEKSFRQLLQRHENLRIRIVADEENPCAIARNSDDWSLGLIDLSTDEKPEETARRLIRREGSQPFDLENDWLIRASLLTLGESDVVLAITIHHMISDGWSMGLLFRELATTYTRLLVGNDEQESPLPIQYADYAAWQEQLLAGGRLDEYLGYWKNRLSGSVALELPTDYVRRSGHAFQSAKVTGQIGEATAAALNQFADSNRCSLFMVMLASFNLLMSRLTGQSDFCIGTPVANRPTRDCEKLIGMFLNTVVLRTSIDPQVSFADYLIRVRDDLLSDFAYQDAPFEQIINQLDIRRDTSRTPLFQVMINMINFPMRGISMGNSEIEMFDKADIGSKFDITLYLAENQQGIYLSLVYNGELYHQERMKRLLDQFNQLLKEISHRPQSLCLDYDLCDLAIAEILPQPDQDLPCRDYPHPLQSFALQVEENPNAIAIEDGKNSWSYKELARRSDLVAQTLSENGITSGSVVALRIPRSADLVASLLGVWKTGAVVMIIDPAYPALRQQTMISASSPAILLTDSKENIPLDITTQVSISLSLADIDYSLHSSWTEDVIDVHSPAYIQFTSGSTGVPKGILGSVNPLAHFIDWHISTHVLTATDRFSMLAGLGHDPLLRDTFTPLCLGATLCVPPAEVIEDGGRLAQWMVEQQISVAHLTPAMGQFISGSSLTSISDVLRYAFFGGDRLQQRHVSEFSRWAPATRIVNFYGATETPQAMASSMVNLHSSESIPLGNGIDGVQVLVVNEAGRRTGIGEIGEIWIRSAYLALGYLQEDPEDRFIDNPWLQGDKSRIYCTGDLGRYTADGSVEFIGRRDAQVKIRGFRVEPGEIDNLLSAHPRVRAAVSQVIELASGEPHLVSYLVANADQSLPDTAELRQFVGASLPDYMIPSGFFAIDSIPLTPNGKIDYRRLPQPEKLERSGGEFVAPEGEFEQQLAEVWESILPVDRVGRFDNFFELGGHSLLATKVVARISKQLHVDVPVKAIFEAPTIEQLSGYLLSMDTTGQELMPLEAAPEGIDYPLSYAQQRLWFLDQFEGASATYNMPAPLRLRGELDIAALEKSLSLLIERHETLRTVFSQVDNQPVQIVLDEVEYKLPVVDLADELVAELQELSESEWNNCIEEEVYRLVRQDVDTPFDLSADLMFRARLLKLADQDHVLLTNTHHIASDGWSVSVMIAEISECYRAFVSGQQPQLEPLQIQYKDYAWCQRQWLEGERFSAQLGYWQERLAGLPPLLELPTDHSRPRVQTHHGSVVSFTLPSELMEQLNQCSRDHGSTLFMTLMASWQILMARYSGMDDIAVGTPIANRTRQELEGMIGFFVNTLTLRSTVSPDDSFSGLLAQVRENTLGAYAHQDVPFESIVDAVNPERSMAHSPLFQVVFSLQNIPSGALSLPGLTLSGLGRKSVSAKFDLNVSMWETVNGAGGYIEYNTDLFEQVTVERMISHFERVLIQVSEQPQKKIADIELITAVEIDELLADTRALTAGGLQDLSVVNCFERQVAAVPDQVAVCCEKQALTYRQLNERVNQLARWLRNKGVCAGSLVGLSIERGLDSIVSVLAILKAGAVYVPLDPDYPADRLQYMVEDSGVTLILTTQAIEEQLPAVGVATMTLEGLESELNSFDTGNPGWDVVAEQGAYVMYTSGSTGRPKGALIPHRAITRLVIDTRFVELDDKTVSLHMAPLGFDASTFELYAPLLNGGRLVIMPSGPVSFEQLEREISTQHVNTLWLTAGLFHSLVDERVEALHGIRQLLAGGDVLSPASINRVLDTVKGIRVINGYGPTENTTFTATHLMQARLDETQSVSIGYPITGTTTYILDDQLRMVPPGVAGELCTGGLGLAHGYLNKPDMTAEKFIPNPYAIEPGERLYRTGDKVRLRTDGSLEFLGRIDQQVKLRGYRIELGEIESVLALHETIRDVCVIAREDRPGDKQLVAYLVADTESPVAELKAFVAERTPEFMVPAAFVYLSELPLTANGKVDRRALPVPDWSGISEEYIAPKTPLQEQLAEIWSSLLGVEKVSIKSSFFDIGGHSLLATQLIARIRQRFDVEVPLKAFFESPTVEALAEQVAELQQQEGDLLPPIEPRQPGERIPLTYAQQRLWYLDQLSPGGIEYNMRMVLDIEGKLDHSALTNAFAAVLQRHEVLRTTFALEESEPVQIVHETMENSLEIIDLCNQPEQERDIIARERIDKLAAQPFDLSTGPLIRMYVIVTGERHCYLMVVMHHVVSDGVSIPIFVREFSHLYAAAVDDKVEPLPDMPLQYGDYAVWQRHYLNESVLKEQVVSWRRRLTDVSTRLKLPTDKSRPPVVTTNGDVVTLELDSKLTGQLRDFCRERGVTVFMALLTAYQVLLARYSQQESFCIGIAGSGREQAEVEGMIGFFANTLVVPCRLTDNPALGTLLKRTRESALETYSNQSMQLETLVDELKIPRDMSHLPLVQVGFTMLNLEGDSSAEAGDLTIRPYRVKHQTSKFELTLGLTDTPNKIGGTLEFNTDLFERSTVERMAEQLQIILRALVDQPDQSWMMLPLIDESQLYDQLSLAADEYERILPMTPMQRDLYLESLLHPDRQQNSLGYSFSIQGEIDPQLWRKALQQIADNRLLLRTELKQCDLPFADIGYFAIRQQREVDFSYVDLTTDSTPDQNRIQQAVDEQIRRPYDVGRDSLVIYRLFKTGVENYLFVLAAHHMILDGAAMSTHADLLCSVYESLNNGAGIELESDGFEPYMQHSRSIMDTEKVLEYWREALMNVEPLTVPVNRGIREKQWQIHQIPDEHWQEIQEYCQQQKISAANYFRTLYGLLLNIYMRPEGDFHILNIDAGRTSSMQHLVCNCYLQTPHIFKLENFAGSTELRNLFDDARQQRKRLGSNQFCSILEQSKLLPKVRTSFMFNYYHFDEPLEILGKEQPIEIYTPDTEGLVEFIAKIPDGHLQLNLNYMADEFDDLRFLERIEHLSRQVTAGAMTVSALDPVLPDEFSKLEQFEINAVADMVAADSRPLRVLDWFRSTAERFAGRIACTDESRELTYRELDEASSRLANVLLAQGFEPGQPLAILLERSLDMVVSMLAAVKVGGTYIPLDTAFPDTRIDYILEDSGTRFMITTSDIEHVLPESVQTLLLDRDSKTIAEASATAPDNQLPEDHPLYVIYTSGTTGNPKGVVVTNRNLQRLFTSTEHWFDFSETDVWTFFHSFAFDFSVWETWGALLYGGRLVVVPKAVARSTSAFYELISEQQVTVLNQTPAAFKVLTEVDAEYAEPLPLSLRLVIFGGEALDFESLRKWVDRYGLEKPQLINMYGITETTVHVTYYRITEADFEQRGSIIGRPIPDLRVNVVGPDLKSLPIGVPGEIVVSGPGVAQGYLKRPELTAERFCINPLACEGHDRIYRSGDLGRFRADGNLEYFGRIDLQVKVRGYRIELGEIESVLGSYPGLVQWVVIAPVDASGNRQLVAYVVCDNEEIQVSGLRDYMGERLPEYMVPAAFVKLETMPLTTNGKIDKRRLPAPDFGSESESELVEPRTVTEQKIAGIWRDLLGVSRVGANSNFFETGGHSLLATRVASSIREQLKCEMPLSLLFENPVLESLAKAVDGLLEDQTAATQLPGLDSVTRPSRLPLSFAQQRLWFLDQLEPGNPFYNMPFSFYAKGDLDVDVLRKVVDEMVERHESFRTSFEVYDDQPYQSISEQVTSPFEYHDLAAFEKLSKPVEQIISEEMARPFDLSRAPLLRVTVYQSGAQEYLVTVVMHHIVSDGWSMLVFFNEVVRLYNAFSRGESSPLPPVRFQYADFACWQRQYLEGDRLDSQLDYWLNHLDGMAELLPLPLDKPRPSSQSFRGSSERLQIDVETTQRLHAISRETGSTLYMVLLAAVDIFLSRYSGTSDIAVGSIIANRNRSEVEQIIGFFVNTLVMRNRVSPEQSFIELLERVRHNTLQAFENQDLPFETLVDAKRVSRNLAWSPLFQVMFALQNLTAPSDPAAAQAAASEEQSNEELSNEAQPNEGSISFTPVKTENPTTRFDLYINLVENKEGIGGVFEYCIDLFNPQTIKRMTDHFVTLVEEIARQPAQPIYTYKMIDEDNKTAGDDEESIEVFEI